MKAMANHAAYQMLMPRSKRDDTTPGWLLSGAQPQAIPKYNKL